MNWRKGLKGKVKLREPLKKHTSFKIGGAAKFFLEPVDADDLKSTLSLLKKRKIPFSVIGAGTNLLAGDKRLNRAVLSLSAPYFRKIFFQGSRVELGSGVRLSRFMRLARKRGLSGAEFLAGIPGTIGGAIWMNAGIPDRNIGNLVENVTVIDYNGNIKTLAKKKLNFSYRASGLSEYIVLSARLRLTKKNPEQIRDKIGKYLGFRQATQDLTRPSAGCIFKNPPGYSAGKLIDLCGLKGKRIGDACISRKHANFILNCKNARARDVLKLMALAKNRVRQKFKIILEPEIKIWR